MNEVHRVKRLLLGEVAAEMRPPFLRSRMEAPFMKAIDSIPPL